MKKYIYPTDQEVNELFCRPALERGKLSALAREILKNVKARGDQALREYSERFDGAAALDLRVSRADIIASEKLVCDSLKRAIELAAKNIDTFHRAQRENMQPVQTMPGVSCWRRSIPIERVGLYVPGGTAPLSSSFLMLAVPAMVAGCREIVVCTPPQRGAGVNPAILYTAAMLGLYDVFAVGGAQAIGAMAYGTESIPRVDKVFGPGNQYVQTAKQLIREDGVETDLLAGPSELAIIADANCPAEFIAADLLSQAEHGTDSQVFLLCDSEVLIDKVLAEVERQLCDLPRREIARAALNCSAVILTRDLGEAVTLANRYAPEHLILAVEQPEELVGQVNNAGSVFLGYYACEAVGDYVSGTNHTLPTGGLARSCAGLSLDSFVKKVTFQSLTRAGLAGLADAVAVMAEAEGLVGHKNSVAIRRNML